MIPVDEGLARLAWTQAWQVTVLIVAVAVMTRLVARNRPHLAHVLWLVVLVKCVTPPVFCSTSGVFCWMQTRPAHVLEGTDRGDLTDVTNSVAVVSAAPGLSDKTEVPAPESGIVSTSIAFDRGAEFADAKRPAAVPATDDGRWISEVLMVGWLVGTVLVLGVALLRLAACRRLIRRSGFRADGSLDRRMARLSRRLKLRRAARLVITESLVGPAVIGLFRATVLVPEVVVRDKSAEDLEPILVHELMHVRRGDMWVGMLQMVAQAVWWFHPLVWWAGRVASREAERCCDEAVVAELGCDPARYARCLFGVLEQKRALKPLPAFPGVRPVEVTSKRLERIMKLGQGSRKRSPWWCWVVMVAAAVLVLPGAALMIGADEELPLNPAPSVLPPPGSLKAPDGVLGFEPGSEPLEMRAHEVNDLLVRIRAERRLGIQEARDFLLDALKQSNLTASLGIGSPEIGLRSIEWTDKKLVVRDIARLQDRIASALDVMRKHGFGRIDVEVRFIRSPRETVDAPGLFWELVEMEMAPAEEMRLGAPALPAAIEFPSPDDRPRANRARVVVEKNLPVICTILTPQRVRRVTDRLQSDSRANVLRAPGLTVFNGQPVCVSDCSQKPFVVGLTDDGQPQVRVVSEGTILRLRTILGEEDSLRLDYELLMPRVKKVETTVLPSAPGEALSTTLQVPEVETARVDGVVDLPDGNALLIGGLALTSADGDSESVMVMIQPRKLASEEVEPREGELLSVTYDVSDFVLPVGPCFTSKGVLSDASPIGLPMSKEASADLEPLIELIEATIAPHTWKEVGGRGRIKPVRAKLSLTVLQTEEVQDEIADLVAQLCSLQKRTRIVLRGELVCLPEKVVDRIGIDFAGIEGHTALAKREAQIFRAMLDGADVVGGFEGRLLNGQMIQMAVRSGTGASEVSGLDLHPTTNDWRTVNLFVVINSEDGELPVAETTQALLGEGESLLVDVTGRVKQEAPESETAGGQGIPKEEAGKTLLLVTPSIVIEEEEEERLGIVGVTPTVIIEEEEEDRLGIVVP